MTETPKFKDIQEAATWWANNPELLAKAVQAYTPGDESLTFTHEQIAIVAYFLWQGRTTIDGPDQTNQEQSDWYDAMFILENEGRGR